MNPTVLKGSNHLTTAQNEMFGPVVTIIRAKDDAEALELANDTEAGLCGALHTQDRERAFAHRKQVEDRDGTS